MVILHKLNNYKSLNVDECNTLVLFYRCLTKIIHTEVYAMASKKILINFRVKPKTDEKLQKVADSKDITKSELLRDIVENYINLL